MSHVTEITACRPYLMRVAVARVGDPQRAEDLVQDTLLAALRTRAPFAGRSRFRTWLTGILLHKVADTFRAKARQADVIVNAPAPPEALENPDDFDAEGAWRAPVTAWSDPHLALETKRFREAFEAGLSRLPPKQSRAFALREIAGLEVDEVCEVLRVTPNNLGVLLHRARVELRRSLDRDYFSAA